MTLLAAYNFDESSGDVLDRSGNGRDWSLNNSAVRTTPGHTNNGMTKSAGGGTLPVIAEPASWMSANQWTIMFWQRYTTIPTTWWFRLYNNGQISGHGFLNLTNPTHFQFRVRDGATPRSVEVALPPADGSWHHYAGTFDGNVGRVYLDGVLAGTTAAVSSPVTIDRIDIAEHGTNSFTMDDIRIFDIDLTQEEIETYMNTPVVDSPAVGTSRSKYYNGSSWVDVTPKFYNGSAWVDTAI